tara:strand:+ start:1564 stop:1854 length:291 start_codon:yes stop_codon:yes gene_type:complete
VTQNKLQKLDISKDLSKKTGFSISYSKNLIEGLINILKENISKNNLILKNIGSFKVVNKKKRLGRNPKTKEIFIIKEQKSIKFSLSKKLYKKINEG